MRSARHAAVRALRADQRASGDRPPGPGPLGRLRWRAVARDPGTRGRLAALFAWLGLFTAVAYLPHGRAHLAIPAATTSLLAVIWQVQAATVALVFALAVFVFGLLQGRGRLTYRDFLRRTLALPLATFNVASLAFNGMVLLGLGRQVPGTASAPGHGWAVTEASVIALSSIVTIVVVLAGTVRAIDPDTEADVRREHRETAVAMAARSELLQDKSLDMMKDWRRSAAFLPTYSGPGRPVAFSGPRQGIVRDVSVWKLRLIALSGTVFRRGTPVVQVWPGKPVSAGDPLVTIDASSGRLARRWAEWSVSVRAVRTDRLETALAALHGETLEHIRAGRPTEVEDGLRAFLGLQELLWKTYAAHGRAYGPDPGRSVVRYARGPGDRIDELLDELLRAAAVSGDPAIQRQASAIPRVIAREALYQEVPAAIRQALSMLEGVYIAVVGELSDGGGRGLPAMGLAQRRLDAPFGSLLAFADPFLGPAIDQAASGAGISWDRRRLPPTDFLLGQLQAANEAMLRMLRHAVQFGDSTTAVRALAKWKMPDLPLARNAAELQASADPSPCGDSGAPQPAGGLAQALADAQDCLDAMLLRLLVTALDADRAAQQKAFPSAPGDGDGAPDPVAEAILARLPNGDLWRVLETAIRTSDGDWNWQARDEGIIVSGEVVAGSVDTLGPLAEAFALAAIACPRLAAADPSRELALHRAQSLITAVGQAPAREGRWLARHGCPPDEVARNADTLKERLSKSAEAAEADLELEIRASPVRADTLDKTARLARAAFRERDIVGALFVQAGKTAEEGEGLHPITVAFNADRRWFTSTDDAGWDVGALGSRMGAALAVRSLQLLHLITARDAEGRAVRLEDAAGAVREAIVSVSTSPAGTRRRPAVGRAVVLIPGLAYADRQALQIERAGQNGRLATAASRALRQFGLGGEGLAAQVSGIIDGTPVIETGIRQKSIVVIDLARFGVLRRGTPGGASPPEPELALYEVSDPLRPDSGDAPAPVVGDPPGPLQVQVSLSLLSGIDVKDPAAVRIIKLK